MYVHAVLESCTYTVNGVGNGTVVRWRRDNLAHLVYRGDRAILHIVPPRQVVVPEGSNHQI